MNNFEQKVGYGFGDFSSSMFWKIFTYFLPIFYTNVFGLTLADAGMLMLITKMWDAVSDPMMGIIADRTNTRWGKYRPYLLWIALPFAIAGVLLFTTPPVDYTGKLIWAYTTYILMMTVYTAINVPYGAMLGVVSGDSDERTIFSSFRMFFAYAGSFLAVAIFEPMRDMFAKMNGVANSENDPTSWQMAMIVIAVLCLIFFLFCFAMTRENVKIKENTQKRDIIKDFKIVISNRPWWILLGVSIAIILFNTVRGATAAYYFADYLGDDNFMGEFFGRSLLLSCTIFLAIGEVANMVGVALAPALSKALGKKNAYIAAMLMIGILSIPFYWLTDGSLVNYWLIILFQVLISICAGVTLPLVWSMVADVADHSECTHKRSTVGLIFSSSSMAQKIGGAIGSAMVLWLLDAYGYQAPKEGVSIAQTTTAINGLRSLMSWIPGLASILGALIMFYYPLNEKIMAQVRTELETKYKEE